MRRREFIAVVVGAVATWPPLARAQQRERMRRIGVFLGGGNTLNDQQPQARNAALIQGLGERGWMVGRNLQIDMRWAGNDSAHHAGYVAEMLAQAPEVIVAVGASIVPPLLTATRTVPIVFVQVTDPVGSGFVTS
jgi:putative tryptophan/tyrosine transport system substrate-binding protein